MPGTPYMLSPTVVHTGRLCRYGTCRARCIQPSRCVSGGFRKAAIGPGAGRRTLRSRGSAGRVPARGGLCRGVRVCSARPWPIPVGCAGTGHAARGQAAALCLSGRHEQWRRQWHPGGIGAHRLCSPGARSRWSPRLRGPTAPLRWGDQPRRMSGYLVLSRLVQRSRCFTGRFRYGAICSRCFTGRVRYGAAFGSCFAGRLRYGAACRRCFPGGSGAGQLSAAALPGGAGTGQPAAAALLDGSAASPVGSGTGQLSAAALPDGSGTGQHAAAAFRTGPVRGSYQVPARGCPPPEECF